MSELWLNHLQQQDAQFDAGRVTSFGNLAEELIAARDATALCDLSHFGLILVSGDDAATFMHNQFCNDVLSLGDGAAQWNGWCTPKGRLLTTFLLWKGKQGYFILLPRPLQAAVQKRLQMYVLRSKVKLEDVSDSWVHFGVVGKAAEAQLKNVTGDVPVEIMSSVHVDAGRIIRLSATRFVVVGSAENMIPLWDALMSKGAAKAGAAVWDGAAIREGVINIITETQDSFVPQMANFELIGGLSFKKGCYPGQEIVARTQYRGILKRRMALAHIDGATEPKAGDKLYSVKFGDQACGEVANVAPAAGGGFDLLLVAQIEAIKDKSLHYGALDGVALTMLDLPYSY